MRVITILAVLVSVHAAGCGHYYARRAYRGTALTATATVPGVVVALDNAPPVVVVQADGALPPAVVSVEEGPFVTSVVSGTADASGAWSAGGWAGDASAESGAVVPVAFTVPRLAGSVSSTGEARGLLGILSSGVRVACDLCSEDSVIAALSLLGPISGGSLGAETTIVSSAGARLEASLSHDALPPGGGTSAIVLRAIGGAAPSRPSPVRVHLVIDASTSMESRWDEVLRAALALVARLRAEDELQVVVYSTSARVALPPTRVGDGAAARAVVRRLRCGGRTNIEAGLRAAYGSLAPSGRSIVLLLSDGVPLGGLATARELGELAAEARASMGATTITVGLGTEFHAGVLRSLARRGGGDFRIAPTPADIDALLAAELEAHARIAAREVTLDVALGAGVALDASFDLDTLDAAVSVAGGRISVRFAALSAGETRTVVLPISIAHAGPIAAVTGSVLVDGSRVHGDRELALGTFTSPVAAGAMLTTLDSDLASALLVAAPAVENGDASTASAALHAHVGHVRASGSEASPAVGARIENTLALAAALDALVPGGTWGARRQTAAAMIEWAGGL